MRKFIETPGWNPGAINIAPQHVEMLAVCDGCSEARELVRSTLPTLARQADLKYVEERLRCTSCNHRGAKVKFGHFQDG